MWSARSLEEFTDQINSLKLGKCYGMRHGCMKFYALYSRIDGEQVAVSSVFANLKEEDKINMISDWNVPHTEIFELKPGSFLKSSNDHNKSRSGFDSMLDKQDNFFFPSILNYNTTPCSSWTCDSGAEVKTKVTTKAKTKPRRKFKPRRVILTNKVALKLGIFD